MNELPKVIKRSHAKRNLIAKIKFLNELSYCLILTKFQKRLIKQLNVPKSDLIRQVMV